MTRKQKIAKARRLRAQDKTLAEIADVIGDGISVSTVARWTDDEYAERQRATARAWKERNKKDLAAYDRRYHQEHKHPCPACGHMLSPTSKGARCPGCTEVRRQRIVALWAEGRSMREIEKELGCTHGHLSVEMFRMREQGYDLPHRYRVRNGKRVVA